jgi:RNA polymerase sigma-32 factor
VRLGSTRHGRKLFFQLTKERDRLISAGIQPSTLALAKALDVPEHEVINVDKQLSAPALSLHSPGRGEEGRALSEAVADPRAADPEEKAGNLEMGGLVKEHLAEFATTLRDEREEAIWRDRLTSIDPRSLSELGKRFGVSKERVRQLEVRLKQRLKSHLTRAMGADIDFDFEVPED